MTILESTKLNLEVLKNIQMTSHENMIIKSLESFYENDENSKLFISIVDYESSESSMSIRLIDHFVTKYSKNNKVDYKFVENDVEHSFNVYASYKQQLKAYQKKHFDPFSRGDRIPYFIKNSCVITTIGQLNFFKWFISKKVYDYVMEHQEIIENDMNKKNKNDKIQTNISKTKTKKMGTKQHITTITNNYNNNTKNTSNILSLSKPSSLVVSFKF
jgi:hypothetical protein